MVMNSTHKVEIYRVNKVEKHPNADTLGIVRFEGYQVCVKLSEFKEGDLVAYIPPDNIVPDTPQFSFLQGKRRIKARKFRGEWSIGLLIPAPVGFTVGDDVAEFVGVTHYVPPEESPYLGGDNIYAPSAVAPVYDLEAFRKYGRRAFVNEEPVWVTEKIHGTNARFVFHDGQMYCGSHKFWKRENDRCLWWRALSRYPSIKEFCEKNPGVVLYGEVFGQVQKLKYGASKDEIFIAIFDVFKDGYFMDALESSALAEENNIPTVPLLGVFKFDFDYLISLAEGPSLVSGADHYREGIVVKPLKERWDYKCGRVSMKIVSNEYLEKS